MTPVAKTVALISISQSQHPVLSEDITTDSHQPRTKLETPTAAKTGKRNIISALNSHSCEAPTISCMFKMAKNEDILLTMDVSTEQS